MWYPLVIVLAAIIFSRVRKAGLFKAPDMGPSRRPTVATPKIFLPGERDASGRLRSDAEQIATSGKPYPGT